ncbi:peptidase [Bacillus thuringiensis]|uniref:peptidase n=1 Tax=Bacillus thuringiensis TaxID=1428 RepID=UPI000BF38F56|nr:peptidase [Bacillus thuringiensis]PFF55224.1 peptidase [Bacillus thuringiensis]
MPEHENHDDFTKVIIGLTRVETKIDVLSNVRELAIEAQQSAKYAHLRVDCLVLWMGTTVIGSIIAGAIALLFKFLGK